MGPLGRWLVPLFLLVLGGLLLWDGSLLTTNADTNLAFWDSHSCSGGNQTRGMPCASLSPCHEECSLADGTSFLGACSVAAGFVISVVRWRWAPAGSRPTRDSPRAETPP